MNLRFNLPHFPLAVAVLCAGVVALVFTGCQQTKPWIGPSYRPLFDGQTLNGWAIVDQKGGGYGVTNGVIYCAAGGGGNLMTEKEFDNFVLRFEFKMEEGSNNGIGIRAPLTGDPAYLGMEIQVLEEGAAEDMPMAVRKAHAMFVRKRWPGMRTKSTKEVRTSRRGRRAWCVRCCAGAAFLGLQKLHASSVVWHAASPRMEF